jgi:hypothetical protein
MGANQPFSGRPFYVWFPYCGHSNWPTTLATWYSVTARRGALLVVCAIWCMRSGTVDCSGLVQRQ